MNKRLLGVGASALVLMTGAANAATVDWTTWSNTYTTGQTGAEATGTSAFGAVTYTGEVEQVVADYPSWTPSSSYVGGVVGNAPPVSGGIVRIFGGSGTGTDTITFAHPVTNPILAIWSLGQTGIDASFDFTTSDIALQAGGPSAEYGGSSIAVAGNIVSGVEGNGTIELLGTYSSVSWTNPTYENWYGFTVGVASAVPEPAAWMLMLGAFGGLGAALRAKRRAEAQAA
jgi:hypothetical protein